MAKRLVDIDEKALAVARAELGTRTLKDTVKLPDLGLELVAFGGLAHAPLRAGLFAPAAGS